MNINFQRYLVSKYHIDFHSLHLTTLSHLYTYMEKINFPSQILEVGGGIGSMFTYFTQDKIKFEFDYTLVDEDIDNINFVPVNVSYLSKERGLNFEEGGSQKYRVSNGESICQLQAICSTTEDYINGQKKGKLFNIVIASSYLGIVPVPETLRLIETVLEPAGVLYLPLNYDGLTLFHPEIDVFLDDEIVLLFNQSLDNRRINGSQTGGSLTGRKLLDWLPETGFEIVCAGSSDWCLLPNSGKYKGDEEYFLECILQYVEECVTPLWQDKPEIFEKWLATRRKQMAEGKLSYLAHQLDFLAVRSS